jgi:hypothetical protein
MGYDFPNFTRSNFVRHCDRALEEGFCFRRGSISDLGFFPRSKK